MYKTHPDFNTPHDSATLWRYIDFAEAASLSSTVRRCSSPCASSMDDPFEGSLSAGTIRAREATLAELSELMVNDPGGFRVPRKNLEDQWRQMNRKMRDVVYLNCCPSGRAVPHHPTA